MSFAAALAAASLLLGLALCQRAAEQWREAPPLFGAGAVLGAGLAVLSLLDLLGGVLGALPGSGLVLLGLWALGVAQLYRFDGPYNGGADKMAFLATTCLMLAHLLPDPSWREMALAYLAAQLVLSYVVSGWIKVISPHWRSGAALRDVFAISAYPACTALRGLGARRGLMLAGSWAVIGFELALPLALLHPGALGALLALAAVFHLANACLFGLNRFVWSWIAAFPALIWLQTRLVF